MQDAIARFSEALRLNPDHAGAHNNLGIALARSGRMQDSIRCFEEALRLDPALVKAHSNLGNSLVAVGRVREAVEHYNEALRLKPDSSGVRYKLAWLLATRAPDQGGDPASAIDLANARAR